MKLVLPALLLGACLAGPASSADTDSQEGLAWLTKMAGASRQLNYVGTFVYSNSRQKETSRIAHFMNPGGGEFEKLETLDDPPREIIRTNDQVTCYLPSVKTVVIEKRIPRRFPAMLPDRLTGLSESYAVRKEGMDRVAGHDCQVIVLEPKDARRYGHSFCAEVKSGLPLWANSISDKKEPLESFAFTELEIGREFSRELVRSRYAAKARDWKVDRSGITNDKPTNTGWVLTKEVPGFRKMTEFRRSIAGRSSTVAHIVYSDGLAAISVFIEPVPLGPRPAPEHLSHQGAVNIYTRLVAEYMVTALGEAPARTVVDLAKALEYKGAAVRP